MAPFQAAQFRPDSADIPVHLGVVEIRGSPGARISLALSADPAVLRAAGDRVRVLIERDGETKAFSLAELQRGVTVYTFERAERVRLKYLLERQVAGSVAEGHVRLVQRLTGPATVVSERRLWMPEAGASLALQSLATCAITGPTTTGCDNTVTTSPYVTSNFPNATFQSDVGSGPSQPITITFAKPVRAVTIRIFDSDCSGNQMIASDAAGIVGSLSFSYDNQPGNGGVNETRTITAPVGRSITGVQLIPDPCEYVAYSGSWEALPPCSPTGDPNLDDPLNREKFDSSFQASNPNSPQAERKEHIRAGYRFPDGRVESVDLKPSSAINCEILNVFVPFTKDDGKLIWIWHSHPYAPGELVVECGGKILTKPQPYPPEPSEKDWKLLDEINYQLFLGAEPPVPGYIYDKQQSFRMDPNVVGELARYRYASFDRPVCP